jgi:hypothetical protein
MTDKIWLQSQFPLPLELVFDNNIKVAKLLDIIYITWVLVGLLIQNLGINYSSYIIF